MGNVLVVEGGNCHVKKFTREGFFITRGRLVDHCISMLLQALLPV